MRVNSVTPDLMVEDVEETVEWYERVLDAELVATLPTDADADYFWAQVMIDGSPLMFQERGSLEEKLPVLEGESIGGPVPLYVDVDDAEHLHGELDEAGVDVVNSPHETEFGWLQFAVTDCNGYVLWFGEELDTERAEDIGRQERLYGRQPIDERSSDPPLTRRSSDVSESEHWG